MGKIITTENLSLYHSLLEKYIDTSISERALIILEESYLNFPSIGDEHYLYIDTTQNVIFRWSDDKVSYYRLGENCEEVLNNIQIINGIGKLGG